MTPDELITPEEQREAAKLIAEELGKRGLTSWSSMMPSKPPRRR